MFKIGDVAQRLALNPQTLYFYERIGLIPAPQRTEAGYRLFSQQDVDRLAFITRAKSLGLSLDEIRSILALKDGKSLTCQDVHDRLVSKLDQIETQIQQLQRLHDELRPLIQECRSNFDPAHPDKVCIVLENYPAPL
ncbi:heavy metal-responsive transcriptional regulator [Leptolyngbya sp. CCY15150]|uniref:heavy metal-responsive transcriptional regulator n=1 Tax=Leptolyngbya sp. CCY15150 TaxID=2767772 RepID=UPI001951F358|nr:heavy metal-responsive transcriptional regulator [Leptolyngbya sp. CCY15150]